MANVLRYFEASELAAGLRAHGHEVSNRTVQRWKAGDSEPKPQDLAAVWRLLGLEARNDRAIAESASPYGAGLESLERKLDLLLVTAGIDPVDAEDEREAKRLLAKARARLRRAARTGAGS